MIMTKKYFYDNVDMGCEVEYDNGHRQWFIVQGKNVDSFWNNLDDDEHFSDEDLCCTQSDDKIRYFLNLVEYNCDNNPIYKHKTIWDVIEIALDNWDY